MEQEERIVEDVNSGNSNKSNKSNAGRVLGCVFGGLGVIIVLIILGALCIERIPTGYIGVIYSVNGGATGETLQQGWHIVSPMKKVEEFTIGNEQFILSKDKREGSTDDDSFLVATSDNANIRISFQMTYKFHEPTVVDTYTKFRGLSGERIVEQRVRTVLKSRISNVTKNYTMMDIYSEKRGEIDDKITVELNEKLGSDFGLEILNASIVDVHPDEQLEKSIKDRVTAMQNKQQKQAEQEAIKVEAETRLIEANNAAAIKVTQAEAQAKEQTILAEAQANANKLLAESITQELIDMKNADARLKHGWITTQGGTPIVDTTNK